MSDEGYIDYATLGRRGYGEAFEERLKSEAGSSPDKAGAGSGTCFSSAK